MPIAQQDRHFAIVIVRGDEVLIAVAVEITDRHGLTMVPRRRLGPGAPLTQPARRPPSPVGDEAVVSLAEGACIIKARSVFTASVVRAKPRTRNVKRVRVVADCISDDLL